MNSKMVMGIVGAVVVVGGVIFAVGQYKPGTPAASPTASVSVTAPSNAVMAATITYNDSGFTPATTTVKSGDAVKFTNASSSEIQVDSNPHPVHTDDTDLNVGAIEPGQSKTVTLTKKGSFGFHNHLDASNMANITIQ